MLRAAVSVLAPIPHEGGHATPVLGSFKGHPIFLFG